MVTTHIKSEPLFCEGKMVLNVDSFLLEDKTLFAIFNIQCDDVPRLTMPPNLFNDLFRQKFQLLLLAPLLIDSCDHAGVVVEICHHRGVPPLVNLIVKLNKTYSSQGAEVGATADLLDMGIPVEV
jgi:hypothetical protein